MDLKSDVRNGAQSMGSMAEGYIASECITFCSRYFQGVETHLNRPQCNDDHVPDKDKYLFGTAGYVLGKVEIVQFDDRSLAQAHRYVILQSDKIAPYLE